MQVVGVEARFGSASRERWWQTGGRRCRSWREQGAGGAGVDRGTGGGRQGRAWGLGWGGRGRFSTRVGGMDATGAIGAGGVSWTDGQGRCLGKRGWRSSHQGDQHWAVGGDDQDQAAPGIGGPNVGGFQGSARTADIIY